MNPPDLYRPPLVSRAFAVRRLLFGLGVAVAVMTLIAVGLAAVAHWREDESLSLLRMSDLALGLVSGLGLAAILIALSSLTRFADALSACANELRVVTRDVRESADTLHRCVEQAGREPVPSLPRDLDQHVAAVRAACDEMLILVRDARENTLLSDEQRREKALRVEQHELDEGRARVDVLTADGDFLRASQVLEDLRRRYPGRAALVDLERLVAQRRERREHEDMHQFARRIDEYINISAWDRARGVLEELRQRYPEAAGLAQLQTRIEREYELYEDAQRRQMYAEIQRYVSRKRWSEALAAAQTFIERFPHRDESDALKLQLQTLAGNAEVAARQDMEAEITELAKRGQYAEAEALALMLIQRWPDSAQAEIMRSQLDRLHELATNPNAPPPRVRPPAQANSPLGLPPQPQTG